MRIAIIGLGIWAISIAMVGAQQAAQEEAGAETGPMAQVEAEGPPVAPGGPQVGLSDKEPTQ